MSYSDLVNAEVWSIEYYIISIDFFFQLRKQLLSVQKIDPLSQKDFSVVEKRIVKINKEKQYYILLFDIQNLNFVIYQMIC